MNKKLIAWVACAVIAGILLLWTVLRHSAFGESHNLGNDIIGFLLIFLGLPMKVYSMCVLGENGHWPLPVLILFLVLSGLMWGIFVERIAWCCSKLKNS